MTFIVLLPLFIYGFGINTHGLVAHEWWLVIGVDTELRAAVGGRSGPEETVAAAAAAERQIFEQEIGLDTLTPT